MHPPKKKFIMNATTSMTFMLAPELSPPDSRERVAILSGI